MKRDAATPAEYLAQIPERQRALIEFVRSAILRDHPDIVEGLRYGMLDYPGLANLAAQKSYVALYVSASVLAEFKTRFEGVSCGKSCLRFRRLEQVDDDALRDLLRAVRRARQGENSQ